jgi:hypothetical protein
LPTQPTIDARRSVSRAIRSLALAVLAASFATSAATLSVGANSPIKTIAAAAQLARDGDVVEIAAGDYRGDVAVWLQKRLTIRGVGGTPVLIADGRIAEGKAIWVIRNGDFTIEDIAFEGARASAGNGAGIRFERGRLTLRRCRFTDDENGVLTGNVDDSELTVVDSEFSRAPHREGSLKHLLYVGTIARFTLRGSHLHRGFRGHLVKSRARESRVSYNLINDGAGGRASYELEFPNGGNAYVIGNVIGQSADTENPALVSYGAEGPAWPRNALYLVNNTLLSERTAGAWFLRVATDRMPAGIEVVAVNNLTVGLGLFALASPGRFEGNFPVPKSVLGDTQTLDFRLGATTLLKGAGVTPPVVDGESLAPTAEFALPLGTTPLAARDAWTPGAFQTLDARR